MTNLSQNIGRLACYPQATTSSPAESSAQLEQRISYQRQAILPLITSARAELAEYVSTHATAYNPAADSPARTALLGRIAGHVAKLDVCNATTNALADAECAATQARVSAIVSSPWGYVRVGDPDRANLFVGSRQVVSEADLFNGCLTSHRSTGSAVPDDVRARIAILVKAANPSPVDIVIYANDNIQVSFDPTTSNSTGFPHNPADCTQIYRIDLVCIDGRLQADTDSVLAFNVRLDVIGTASEQIAPIPNLPAVSQRSFVVDDSASCAAIYYHLAQHEEFGRTHGAASLLLAEALDSNFRSGARRIETEPSGPVHAAEISLEEAFGAPHAPSSANNDIDDELIVASRDRSPTPPTHPAAPHRALSFADLGLDTDDETSATSHYRNPAPSTRPTAPSRTRSSADLGLVVYSSDSSSSDSAEDSSGWVDADADPSPPTKRRKQQHPTRRSLYTNRA